MTDTHPGNTLKYCPKCGSAQFVFDGIRAFKCNNCDFHFFINSSAAVAALITNSKGELLLTRRAFNPGKGLLDLPGGFVDPMERAEEAVIREIKEELNLNVTQLKYLGSFPNEYVFSGFSVFTTDLGFHCQVDGFEYIHAEDDISGFEFVSQHQIDYSQVSSESISQLIQLFFQQQS